MKLPGNFLGAFHLKWKVVIVTITSNLLENGTFQTSLWCTQHHKPFLNTWNRMNWVFFQAGSYKRSIHRLRYCLEHFLLNFEIDMDIWAAYLSLSPLYFMFNQIRKLGDQSRIFELKHTETHWMNSFERI